MIIPSKVCRLLVSFIVLTSVSAFDCSENQACSCQRNLNDNSLEILCLTSIFSSFAVKILPNEYIRVRYIDGNWQLAIEKLISKAIRQLHVLTFPSHRQVECVNSPNWSDFHLTSIVGKEQVKWIQFHMCDLPYDTSLGNISRMLGATEVEKLTFQSYKNLSFTLEKRHFDDFKNLKYLILSSNNVSYVHEDLLTGLANLTGLNLRENNLHLSDGFFNYTPGLQWLELGNNDLQSIKRGTFDHLRNLTQLNLWKNHLIGLESDIFDQLVSLQILDLNANNLTNLDKDIFAKLGNLTTLNLARNNFTHLPSNLLRNNTKLQTVNLFDNKQNMTSLPNGFFANLPELKVLKLKRSGFLTLPEDLFWGSCSLTNISLERNYLKTLPVLIFRDSKQLTELDLSFNSLEQLPDNIFSNTSRLNKLDLSKNHFTFISRCVVLLSIRRLKQRKNKKRKHCEM